MFPFLFNITLSGGGIITRLVWGEDYDAAYLKAISVYPDSEIRNANIE